MEVIPAFCCAMISGMHDGMGLGRIHPPDACKREIDAAPTREGGSGGAGRIPALQIWRDGRTFTFRGSSTSLATALWPAWTLAATAPEASSHCRLVQLRPGSPAEPAASSGERRSPPAWHVVQRAPPSSPPGECRRPFTPICPHARTGPRACEAPHAIVPAACGSTNAEAAAEAAARPSRTRTIIHNSAICSWRNSRQ